MTEDQKNNLKSFAKSEHMFNDVKDFVLDFGIIDDGTCSDAELGARYRAQTAIKKELKDKFRTMRFLIDDRAE